PLIAVVAVLLVAGGIGLAVALTSGDDDDKNTADDRNTSQTTDDPTDETETDDPTDGPTDGQTSRGPSADFVNCAAGDPLNRESTPVEGQLVGGKLSVPIPAGFTHEPFYGEAFAFAFDTDVAYRSIETYWISTLVVGRI